MSENREKRIMVKNVSKRFSIGTKGPETMLGRIVNFVSGRENKKNLQALENINFEAYAGENIGIIGRNGSGKSTLLRLIAGIYKPDSGAIETKGKMLYMSGWSHGLKPRLTMRENIFLVGAIMGLSEPEIKAKFDEIVEFSGLQDFVDTKVYQFSSGMTTRLSFSIGIHCLHAHNPDILLLDEILSAGGDADFKSKANLKIKEFIDSGATVILVSHSLGEVEKFCDRVIWIEKSKIVEGGTTAEVIEKYKSSNIK